ncbi:MAG TPA: hypothetical protein VLX68_12290 [Chitinivibrionales bacterium]|nr:hypothetical protein [Chitinivibrionales bacterium]
MAKMDSHRFLPGAAAVICLILLPLSDVKAAGYGFYGSLGFGEGVFNSELSFPDLSYARIRMGGGFVFDNALEGNSIFNYRLNLGADGIIDNVQDATDNIAYHFDGFRLNWINDFGFAIVRVPGLRWWIGPQLGFHYLDESDGYGTGIFSLDFSAGAVTGINFNTPGGFTFGLDFALRYIGEAATKVEPSYQDVSYFGNGLEFGLTASFIIRGIMVHRVHGRRYY